MPSNPEDWPAPDTTALHLPKHISETIALFRGRKWILPVLTDWLKDTDKRFFVLTGPPGSGKSSVVAWLSGATSTHGSLMKSPFSSAVTATHFCISGNTADPKLVVDSIGSQLAKKLSIFDLALSECKQESSQIVINQNVHAGAKINTMIGVQITGDIRLTDRSDDVIFNRLLCEPLRRIHSRGFTETIVLLIDGLDETTASASGVRLSHLLSALKDAPPSIRVIVSTRSDPRVLKHFQRSQTIDLLGDIPQNCDDVRSYVEERLTPLPASTRDRLIARIVKAAKGNFLYAHLVVTDLLRRDAKSESEVTVNLPKDLEGIYTDFLNRELGADEDRWYADFRTLLGLIAVAFGDGMSRSILKKLLKRDIDRDLRVIAQYLVGDLPEGPFRLFHKSFQDFLLSCPTNSDYTVEAVEMHEMLVRYYKSPETDWSNAAWASAEDYALLHLPAHIIALVEGKRESNSVIGFPSRQFMTEKRLRFGSYNGFAADLELIQACQMQFDNRALIELVRCSAIGSAIRSFSGAAGTPALRLLVKLGRSAQALDLASLIVEPADRVRAMLEIATAALSKGEFSLATALFERVTKESPESLWIGETLWDDAVIALGNHDLPQLAAAVADVLGQKAAIVLTAAATRTANLNGQAPLLEHATVRLDRLKDWQRDEVVRDIMLLHLKCGRVDLALVVLENIVTGARQMQIATETCSTLRVQKCDDYVRAFLTRAIEGMKARSHYTSDDSLPIGADVIGPLLEVCALYCAPKYIRIVARLITEESERLCWLLDAIWGCFRAHHTARTMPLLKEVSRIADAKRPVDSWSAQSLYCAFGLSKAEPKGLIDRVAKLTMGAAPQLRVRLLLRLASIIGAFSNAAATTILRAVAPSRVIGCHGTDIDLSNAIKLAHDLKLPKLESRLATQLGERPITADIVRVLARAGCLNSLGDAFTDPVSQKDIANNATLALDSGNALAASEDRVAASHVLDFAVKFSTQIEDYWVANRLRSLLAPSLWSVDRKTEGAAVARGISDREYRATALVAIARLAMTSGDRGNALELLNEAALTACDSADLTGISQNSRYKNDQRLETIAEAALQCDGLNEAQHVTALINTQDIKCKAVARIAEYALRQDQVHLAQSMLDALLLDAEIISPTESEREALFAAVRCFTRCDSASDAAVTLGNIALATDSASLEHKFWAVEALAGAGDVQAVLELCRSVQRQWRHDSSDLYKRAMDAVCRKKRGDLAIALSEAAVGSISDLFVGDAVDELVRVGRDLHTVGRTAEAIQVYDSAIGLASNRTSGLLQYTLGRLAEGLAEAGDWHRALAVGEHLPDNEKVGCMLHVVTVASRSFTSQWRAIELTPKILQLARTGCGYPTLDVALGELAAPLSACKSLHLLLDCVANIEVAEERCESLLRIATGLPKAGIERNRVIDILIATLELCPEGKNKDRIIVGTVQLVGSPALAISLCKTISDPYRQEEAFKEVAPDWLAGEHSQAGEEALSHVTSDSSRTSMFFSAAYRHAIKGDTVQAAQYFQRGRATMDRDSYAPWTAVRIGALLGMESVDRAIKTLVRPEEFDGMSQGEHEKRRLDYAVDLACAGQIESAYKVITNVRSWQDQNSTWETIARALADRPGWTPQFDRSLQAYAELASAMCVVGLVDMGLELAQKIDAALKHTGDLQRILCECSLIRGFVAVGDLNRALIVAKRCLAAARFYQLDIFFVVLGRTTSCLALLDQGRVLAKIWQFVNELKSWWPIRSQDRQIQNQY